jgi:hypothetical protein
MRINNKMPQFKKSLYSVMADALKEGASEVVKTSKDFAPMDKANLRADVGIQRNLFSKNGWKYK